MITLTAVFSGVLLSAILPDGRLRHATPLSEHVTLSLTADRETYFPGERVQLRIVAQNTSTNEVTGHFEIDPLGPWAKLLVRYQSEPFVDLQALRWKGEFLEEVRTLAPHGQHVVVSDVSVTTYQRGIRRFVLDRTGRYEFKLSYIDTSASDPNGFLESAPLAIDVVSPPAEEGAAHTAYTPDLAYVAQFQRDRSQLTAEEMRAAAAFVRQFPTSRYAVAVKEGLRRWLSFRTWIPGRATPEERELWEAMFKDHTRPQLTASASPARLWPPNGKMVPVSMSLSVRDDYDPSPVVRLVSITCDDGCDRAIDVGNASFDSDDRVFELRATRHGTGKGRTYRVTYSATDSSGNQEQVTVDVLVPHDARR